MFVKTGDKVKVIAGNDKGKEGIVLQLMLRLTELLLRASTR